MFENFQKQLKENTPNIWQRLMPSIFGGWSHKKLTEQAGIRMELINDWNKNPGLFRTPEMAMAVANQGKVKIQGMMRVHSSNGNETATQLKNISGKVAASKNFYEQLRLKGLSEEKIEKLQELSSQKYKNTGVSNRLATYGTNITNSVQLTRRELAENGYTQEDMKILQNVSATNRQA